MGNNYTTTLHLINSAVIKLSKTTNVSKVYRGLSGRALPTTMLKANEHAVRGGVEFAFLSTSTSRAVAEQYSNGPVGVIFEIQQGLTDRGADIQWLSQYSFEAEVLFPPLSALEVLRWRQEGQKIIFEMRLSVNLTAEPIERVIAKFKTANLNLIDVLRSSLHSGGAPPLSLLSMDGFKQICQRLPNDWYDIAENYEYASRQAFSNYRDALGLLSQDDMWRQDVHSCDVWRKQLKSMRKLATIAASSGVHDAAIRILATLYKNLPLAVEGLELPDGTPRTPLKLPSREVMYKTYPPRRTSDEMKQEAIDKALEAMAGLGSAVLDSVEEAHMWRLETAAFFLAEGARQPFPGVLVRMISDGGQQVISAFGKLVRHLFTEDRLARGSKVLVLRPRDLTARVVEHRWKEAEVTRTPQAEGQYFEVQGASTRTCAWRRPSCLAT